MDTTTDPRVRVQRNGRSTSWEAALSITNERTAELYRKIRHALANAGQGLTDEELETALRASYPQDQFSSSGIRSRRNELVGKGWVTEARADDGSVLKRRSAAGTRRIVWRAALEGEEAPTGTAGPSKAEQAHADGLEQARRFARWHIGDSSWGERIVRAYLDPETARTRLDAEGAQ